MKKLIAIFTALMTMCLTALPISAQADVIYDPIGDLAGGSDLGTALLILIGASIVITAALLLLKKFRK